MTSIAMFHASHTNADQVWEKLSSKSDFISLTDTDIINEAAQLFPTTNEKFNKALYKKTSVFNKFTQERELHTAYLKAALAQKLEQSNILLSGYASLLVPKELTHVLKVLIVDTRENRLQRAVDNGLSTGEAEKAIRNDDISAYHWAEFLHDAEPWDSRLYDMVIPVDQKQPEDIVELILKQCSQATLLETKESAQAIKDMQLNAKVEIDLLSRGQKAEISSSSGNVTVTINKSVLNFNALSKELSEQVSAISGVDSVKVIMGKDYSDSIYRDQEFIRPPKVLLVDDEKEFASTLSERLINRNVGTHAVYDGQEALDFMLDDAPDVMILDLKMPGVSGLEVLETTKKKNPRVEIIILTGHGSEEDRKNCLELGAFAYLQKPTDIQTLSETIQKAHQQAMLNN